MPSFLAAATFASRSSMKIAGSGEKWTDESANALQERIRKLPRWTHKCHFLNRAERVVNTRRERRRLFHIPLAIRILQALRPRQMEYAGRS
jgi:hypothetical protein